MNATDDNIDVDRVNESPSPPAESSESDFELASKAGDSSNEAIDTAQEDIIEEAITAPDVQEDIIEEDNYDELVDAVEVMESQELNDAINNEVEIARASTDYGEVMVDGTSGTGRRSLVVCHDR
jgi:hypothetical protein